MYRWGWHSEPELRTSHWFLKNFIMLVLGSIIPAFFFFFSSSQCSSVIQEMSHLLKLRAAANLIIRLVLQKLLEMFRRVGLKIKPLIRDLPSCDMRFTINGEGFQGRDAWGHYACWTPSHLDQPNGDSAGQGPWAFVPAGWLIALGQVHHFP